MQVKKGIIWEVFMMSYYSLAFVNTRQTISVSHTYANYILLVVYVDVIFGNDSREIDTLK